MNEVEYDVEPDYAVKIADYNQKYLREDLVRQLIPVLCYELGAADVVKQAKILEAYILNK